MQAAKIVKADSSVNMRLRGPPIAQTITSHSPTKFHGTPQPRNSAAGTIFAAELVTLPTADNHRSSTLAPRHGAVSFPPANSQTAQFATKYPSHAKALSRHSYTAGGRHDATAAGTVA